MEPQGKRREPINLNWGKETLKSSCSIIAFEPVLYAQTVQNSSRIVIYGLQINFMMEPHFTEVEPEAQRGEVTRAGTSFAMVNEW